VKSGIVLLALQRATHTTLHRLTGELADLGLTAAEINALAILSDARARGVSELAAEAGARPSTMTSLLDRLEQRGHVARSTEAGDRRVVRISLTEPGEAAAKRIRSTMIELERRALGGLPDSAVAGFHDVLRALSEAAR
jgi:DNA-binding MarR family transcriptional regulator